MAGSRLEKVGTIFTRVRDLIRAGVIRESKKPIWFDVYAAFPPKREPVYVKPVRRVRRKTEENVPEIFYTEDQIRAKFYELYGNGTKPFDLTKTTFVSTCQRFVEKYSELESRGDVKPEILLEETAKALLLSHGLVLKRRGGGPAVAAEKHKSVLDMKLSDMLVEQQKGTVNVTDTLEEQTHPAHTKSLNTS